MNKQTIYSFLSKALHITMQIMCIYGGDRLSFSARSYKYSIRAGGTLVLSLVLRDKTITINPITNQGWHAKTFWAVWLAGQWVVVLVDTWLLHKVDPFVEDLFLRINTRRLERVACEYNADIPGHRLYRDILNLPWWTNWWSPRLDLSTLDRHRK